MRIIVALTMAVCLLQRWTFPFVPDTNLLPLSGTQGVSSYRMSLSRLELTYRLISCLSSRVIKPHLSFILHVGFHDDFHNGARWSMMVLPNPDMIAHDGA